jgi:diguanylate cyclase (GGDEF)-like protein
MGLAIENAVKYQQAESSATTDYLTGLPNARSLFLQLDRELARCKRDGKSLTVMVCDLDGFKTINDRFGHLEGNRVLRLFGQALKESCREYDYVARMGGDEFVLVAPGLASDVAGKKADQMQQLAKQAGLEVCAEDILSLSVGLAICPEDGANAEQLLAQADRRMYMEKQRRPSRKNRRLHARMKCRVTLELQTEGASAPLFGNLTDISLGGCYVETSAVFSPGTKLKLFFTTSSGPLQVEGNVTRLDLGSGVAVQFDELKREGRDNMLRVLDYVQNTTMVYENQYLASLLKS